MIRAVYNCSVILSGIGWNGSARKCLKLAAERRVFLFVTDEILAEYEAVIPKTRVANSGELRLRNGAK
jgi:predicted nucleic acid-binding protein